MKTRTFMKRLILILVLLMTCASASWAQPAKTPQGEIVIKYFTYLKNGKYDEAAQLVAVKNQKGFVELMRDYWGEEAKKRGGVTSIKIDKVEHSEGSKSAKVYYTLTFKNGTKDSDVIKMLKTQGEWMISPV